MARRPPLPPRCSQPARKRAPFISSRNTWQFSAPAGSKFLKVEAALRALGPSATGAQVLAAVAPLGPALAPIEALLTAPPPTTLEALGQPGMELHHDSTYQTTEEGARLDVGANLYPVGFQVAWTTTP